MDKSLELSSVKMTGLEPPLEPEASAGPEANNLEEGDKGENAEGHGGSDT